MAQHFLLSAAARTLRLRAIYKMRDEQAFEAFKAIRFAENGGEAFCPECGCCDPYFITTRRKWKCRACGKQFSLTSGTVFASRKMALVDLLAAICIFVNGAKGISALQLSRDLDCQYKTAFVLAHKLREAMAKDKDAVTLSGIVEVDGAWFGGKVRPENRKEDRIDRRLAANRSPDRRSVIVVRERGGRTLSFVAKCESEGADIVRQRVPLGSTLHADEAPHWDMLEAAYTAHRSRAPASRAVIGPCSRRIARTALRSPPLRKWRRRLGGTR
jgi:transposase-like protein